jgi:hypothetical protein
LATPLLFSDQQQTSVAYKMSFFIFPVDIPILAMDVAWNHGHSVLFFADYLTKAQVDPDGDNRNCGCVTTLCRERCTMILAPQTTGAFGSNEHSREQSRIADPIALASNSLSLIALH